MRSSLEGAACGELNPEVIDHFFEVNLQRDRVMGQAALNICGRCPVSPECLEDALYGPHLARGIRAGLSVATINRARSWLRYESVGGAMPSRPRPEWLSRSEAAEMAESVLVAADGEEAEDES